MAVGGRGRPIDLWGLERRLRRLGLHRIAGVDEAGCGPLAGPVVAAAVILPEEAELPGLADSKRLGAAAREGLYRRIREYALAVAVGHASPREVDRLNVRRATFLAMRRALARLRIPPDLVLVDGYPIPDLPLRQRALVGGDARCACIAAASIVAKVWRDRLMQALDARYPAYGFARHKGYATEEHRRALERWGPTPLHRLSFHPCRGGCGEGRE